MRISDWSSDVCSSDLFTNVYNPRSAVARKDEYRPTLVKRGATLGANCTIVCGVTIGEYAFVGSGSVVNRDVAPHALLVGVPAPQTGWMCNEVRKCVLSGHILSVRLFIVVFLIF